MKLNFVLNEINAVTKNLLFTVTLQKKTPKYLK